MTNKLEFKESPFPVSAQESEAIVVTVPASWGTVSGVSSVALYEDPDVANTNRTATMLSGAASYSGQVITTRLFTGLTAGLKYRMDVLFTTSEGGTLLGYAILNVQR